MSGTFQMDDYGNFRIAVDGKWSKWANYRGVVVLGVEGGRYFGVSAFYEGVFPVETIFSSNDCGDGVYACLRKR